MENEYQPIQHISQQFDVELENVKSQVLKMGALVKKQLRDGLTALLDGDEKLAKKVIKRDNKVNALEVKIDEACTSIIAIRQPAATDLRFVLSLIKTITDFERIGDGARLLEDFFLHVVVVFAQIDRICGQLALDDRAVGRLVVGVDDRITVWANLDNIAFFQIGHMFGHLQQRRSV